MGAVKQMFLMEKTCFYLCPCCGDGGNCDPEDYQDKIEFEKIHGYCQYCEHVFSKND